MESVVQVLFVTGFGFVASAVTSLLCGLLSGGGSFRLSFQTTGAVLTSFFICMFAGPYLAVENGVRHWISGSISAGLFLMAVLVAAIWSFCAGIFVIQVLAGLGVI